MAFKDVIGQGRALRILKGAMKRNRVASTYLFAGEEGVGKRFTALNFAKALNCKSPADGDACDTCPSCVKLDAGTYPDFMAVEADGEQIKVEQVREVEEALALKPFEGGFKVVVVDDAHVMNISAANAFLKTLEEPAPHSLIILVSSKPEWLPSTIRSRCSRVNFSPLGPSECREVIDKYLGPGHEGIDLLVRLCMGQPGLVLSGDLLKEREAFLEDLQRMLAHEGKHRWEERGQMRRWLQMLQLYLRDVAVLKTTGQAGGLINADLARSLESSSRGADIRAVLDAYEKITSLMDDLRFNPNKGVTWNYAGSVLEASGVGG